jgi:hypothetical protein
MKYSGNQAGTIELEAMAAVARAAKKRSLEEFEATVSLSFLSWSPGDRNDPFR